MTTYGEKIDAGLRAFLEVDAHRYDDHRDAGYWFADAILMRMGFPEKVADSIIDRLVRRDFVEYGVSARTGWLTDKGRLAASRLSSTGGEPTR